MQVSLFDSYYRIILDYFHKHEIIIEAGKGSEAETSCLMADAFLFEAVQVSLEVRALYGFKSHTTSLMSLAKSCKIQR